MSRDIKILFPDQDDTAPLVLSFEGASAESLSKAICESKGWPATRRLRLIAAGRELFSDDLVSADGSPVVHCIVLGDLGQQSSHTRHRNAVSSLPSRDVLDMLNPATALVWLFGSLLCLSWLAVIFYGETFDAPTVALLCAMTAAFVAPFLLPYIPTPSSWQRPCNPITAALPPGYTFVEGPGGGRIAIPPRPPAQIPAASGSS